MTTTYSDKLRLALQGDGDNPTTWGQVANNGVFELIEDAISGYLTLNITGGSNVTLTTANGASDQARNAIIQLTGTLINDIDVIVPTVTKYYFFHATHTGGDVTVKTTSGTGVDITPGQKKILMCDGTNVIDYSFDPSVLGDLAFLDTITSAGLLNTGVISTSVIATAAITTDKIANAAVTTSIIAPLAVTTSLIASLAVTTDKISSGVATSLQLLVADGVGGTVFTGYYPLVQTSAVSPSGGTNIDFTSLPSWVKKITVSFYGLTNSGGSPILLQIGSGSFQTTGYNSSAFNYNSGTGTDSTAGFCINQGWSLCTGVVTLTKVTGNTWTASGVTLSPNVSPSSGGVSLSGSLDRLRVTTISGTTTFTGGSVNIMYE
jgi:hypothetical protein